MALKNEVWSPNPDSLNPAFKKIWLDALRSGEYEQGRDRLRIEDTFCCLGVACDLIEPLGWDYDDDPNLDTMVVREVFVDGLPGIVEIEVPSWGDFGSTDTGVLPFLPEQVPTNGKDVPEEVARYTNFNPGDLIAGMNDTGRTFAQIADWIEANL